MIRMELKAIQPPRESEGGDTLIDCRGTGTAEICILLAEYTVPSTQAFQLLERHPFFRMYIADSSYGWFNESTSLFAACYENIGVSGEDVERLPKYLSISSSGR